MDTEQGQGATHIAGVGGLIPLEQWQESQRQRLDAIRAAQHPAPPPLPPRPDRAVLMAAVTAARQRNAKATAGLDQAEAALARAGYAAAAAEAVLAELDQAEQTAAAELAEQLRLWITAGGTGDRPHARQPSGAATHHRKAAEADRAAGLSAIETLSDAKDKAAEQAEAARRDLHACARAVIRLDAVETAENINRLEREAGELWHSLWAMTYTGLEGAYIASHPVIATVIAEPPRKADRAGMLTSRKTVRSAEAIAGVTARFAALISGAGTDAETMPWTPPPAA